MSVRDLNKCIIISDALNGEIIDNINQEIYEDVTICDMVRDIFYNYVIENEHGLLIKVGYKNN